MEMQLCPQEFCCGIELAKYATYDLGGFQSLAAVVDSAPLTEVRRREIDEHCNHCEVCYLNAQRLREDYKKTRHAAMDEMGKPRREQSFRPVQLTEKAIRMMTVLN